MSESGTKRDTEFKWNGWGFNDSYFYFDKDSQLNFSGDNRYDISGQILPGLRDYIFGDMGIDINYRTPSQQIGDIESTVDPPIINQGFVKCLDDKKIHYSMETRMRMNRAHGHTLLEIFTLRHGKFARVPDIVVWPKNHDEVVDVVAAANENNVAIIPLGGGTSVSLGLQCPEKETRMIVSLDISRMNRLLWIDRENMTARAEGGCVGADLENELNKQDLTLGHEPDSIEASTLGGWVATRASGLKRGKYGNIEDLLVHVTMVTPTGVLEKHCQAPRVSSGPDIHHFILGSEGTIGVVTEVTFKICEKPPYKCFGSVVFPTFEVGVKCMREITKQKYGVASMRLVDNKQFVISQGFKKGHLTIWRKLTDQIKHLYITSWKGFHPDEVCAMTLVFEGTKEEVKVQEKRVYQIATDHGGFSGGAANGLYGYMLTLTVAYMRDFGMEYSCIGESMETAVPWDKVVTLCNNVKEVFRRESEKLGAPHIASCRVTQAYDAGACIYIYYGLNYRNVEHPVETYERIENLAREAIIACGGSISHHHGVGKLRRHWLPVTVGEVGLTAMKAVKQALDPNNIFASGNLFQAVSKL